MSTEARTFFDQCFGQNPKQHAQPDRMSSAPQLYRVYGLIMENRMEKKTENEMETGII